MSQVRGFEAGRDGRLAPSSGVLVALFEPPLRALRQARAMIRLIVFLGMYLLNASSYGPLRALWVFWPICMMLTPNLMNAQRIGSFTLTFDLLVSMAALAMIVAGRGPRAARLRFHALDGIVLLTIMTHMISITINRGFLPMYLPQVPIFYYLSYALGRLYLRDTDDLPRAMRAMCCVLAFACVMVVIEGATRISIIHYLGRGTFRNAEVRYGFARASLGVEHPIALGCVFLMLLPWALEARRWSLGGAGPRWWRHVPKIVFVCLVMTVSRGPILGAIIAVVADRYFQRPRLRTPLLILAVVGGLTFWVAKDAVTSGLTTLLNMGSENAYETTVVIEGKAYVYNGTTHRNLLYLVYREPMRKAGPFGFDVNWVNYIPPDLRTFWSIDNHYIATRMSRGYMGLILTDLLLAGIIITAGRLALRQPHHPLAGLAGSISSSTIGMVLVLFTVVLFRESSAMLLFNAGLVASFRDLPVPVEDEFDEEYVEDEDDLDEWGEPPTSGLPTG
jgi:hypothetical protein